MIYIRFPSFLTVIEDIGDIMSAKTTIYGVL